MANQDELKLVQTRLPSAVYKKLEKAQKDAGAISMASYIRMILTKHVRSK